MSAQTFHPFPDSAASCQGVPSTLPLGLPYLVRSWVAEIAGLTGPDVVCWCNGSRGERHSLCSRLPAGHTLSPHPGQEHPELQADADSGSPTVRPMGSDATPRGPWVERSALRRTVVRLFADSMRGRTMYVVPYLALPDEVNLGLGIELTDSPWVVLNLGLSSTVGNAAIRRICGGYRWTASVHSVGYPLLDKAGTQRPDVPWPCNSEKWIATLPVSGDIWSFGTGFGAVGFADCMPPPADDHPATDVLPRP